MILSCLGLEESPSEQTNAEINLTEKSIEEIFGETSVEKANSVSAKLNGIIGAVISQKGRQIERDILCLPRPLICQYSSIPLPPLSDFLSSL